LDYLFNHTEYFSISEHNAATVTTAGKLDASKCSLLHKVDFTTNQALYQKIAQAIQHGSMDEHLRVVLEENAQGLRLSHLPLETCKLIICFGMEASDLGLPLHLQKNKLYKTESYSVLITDSLSEMVADTAKKKAFWSAMQSHLEK